MGFIIVKSSISYIFNTYPKKCKKRMIQKIYATRKCEGRVPVTLIVNYTIHRYTPGVEETTWRS